MKYVPLSTHTSTIKQTLKTHPSPKKEKMTCGLVRIRLARFGRKNTPVYNIVVANAWKARDAKPIEVLGTYNPIPKYVTQKQKRKGVVPLKEVNLDFERTKYWIGVGAQPSDTVIRLLKKSGILGEEWGRANKRPVVSPRQELYE